MVAYDIQYVIGLGACAEGEVPVEHDILETPFIIGIAHHVELGEIGVLERVGDLVDADGLGLEETDGRICPAGAAAVLVLNRRDRVGLDGGELILGQLGCRPGLGVGAGCDGCDSEDNQ